MEISFHCDAVVWRITLSKYYEKNGEFELAVRYSVHCVMVGSSKGIRHLLFVAHCRSVGGYIAISRMPASRWRTISTTAVRLSRCSVAPRIRVCYNRGAYRPQQLAAELPDAIRISRVWASLVLRTHQYLQFQTSNAARRRSLQLDHTRIFPG